MELNSFVYDYNPEDKVWAMRENTPVQGRVIRTTIVLSKDYKDVQYYVDFGGYGSFSLGAMYLFHTLDGLLAKAKENAKEFPSSKPLL